MTKVVSRTLSVHKEHEVLLKLETAGLNDELAQAIIDSKSNQLATKVVELISRNGYEPSVIEERARMIMGKNFFGVAEAIKHFKVKPLKKHTNALAKVPFTEEILEKCKDTHILIAVFPLSLLEIRKAAKDLFYSSEGGWFESQAFAQESSEPQWCLIQKTPVKDSTFKNWKEQQALLLKNDETPPAHIMVYTIIGHYLNTKERIFENIWVRTSSVDSDGYRVVVGAFDSGGLNVDYDWDDNRNSYLGVSSARKS
ncbi:MAG: hypothetical protein ACKKL6_00220 [Candidatus Komeilibacteria bacterium]